MRKMTNFYCALALFALSTSVYAANPGEGKWVADEIFRAANSTGSTGLINMDSAYTIRDGDVSFNVGVASESVGGTDYFHIPVSFVYGLSNRTEVGLATNYINASVGESGFAGAELKIKWRFRNQTEYFPAMAVGVGLMFPAGPATLNEVTDWGAKLNLLMSSEAAISDTTFIGMYVDIGGVSLFGSDNYYTADAGLLVPISDDQKLQGILEFNSVTRRANPYLGTGDYTAITPGLRYASESFKLTFGAEARSTSTNKLMLNIGWEF